MNSMAITKHTYKPSSSPQSRDYVYYPTTRGCIFLALLAVQFGVQPIITREFISFAALKVSLVLTCEIIKLLLGLVALLSQGDLTKTLKDWTLVSSLKVAALPAIIYAFQNLLVQTAYRNLDGVVFNIINQTKLLWSAVFLYIFLGRKQTLHQIFALLLLMGAAILLSSTSGKSTTTKGEILNSFEFGIIPVVLASVSSGVATALSQSALQYYGRDSNLYSIELAIYSCVTLMVFSYYSNDFEAIYEKGFFYGWNQWTLVPIICNAVGGLIVGQVTKYAGAVLKGFALIAGLLLTAVIQKVVYQLPMEGSTVFAVPMVVFGLYIHTMYSEKEKAKEE